MWVKGHCQNPQEGKRKIVFAADQTACPTLVLDTSNEVTAEECVCGWMAVKREPASYQRAVLNIHTAHTIIFLVKYREEWEHYKCSIFFFWLSCFKRPPSAPFPPCPPFCHPPENKWIWRYRIWNKSVKEEQQKESSPAERLLKNKWFRR